MYPRVKHHPFVPQTKAEADPEENVRGEKAFLEAASKMSNDYLTSDQRISLGHCKIFYSVFVWTCIVFVCEYTIIWREQREQLF